MNQEETKSILKKAQLRGFVTNLVARGLSDEQVGIRKRAYLSQLQNRENNVTALRDHLKRTLQTAST